MSAQVLAVDLDCAELSIRPQVQRRCTRCRATLSSSNPDAICRPCERALRGKRTMQSAEKAVEKLIVATVEARQQFSAKAPAPVRELEAQIEAANALLRSLRAELRELDSAYRNGEQREDESSWQAVCRVVAWEYGVPALALRQHDKHQPVCQARQLAQYLLRQREMSLTTIAKYFHFNHATVLHAVRRVEAKLAVSKEFRLRVDRVRSALAAGGMV